MYALNHFFYILVYIFDSDLYIANQEKIEPIYKCRTTLSNNNDLIFFIYNLFYIFIIYLYIQLLTSINYLLNKTLNQYINIIRQLSPFCKFASCMIIFLCVIITIVNKYYFQYQQHVYRQGLEIVKLYFCDILF